MFIFAHIFVGKEFTDLVSGIGRATLKYGGGTAVANINYMVADCSDGQLNLSRLRVENTAPEPELIGTDHYTNFSWEVFPAIALPEFGKKWCEVYNELINAGDDATQLYVMLHFPLYKKSSLEAFQLLYQGISYVNLPTQLDFVGYTTDLAPVIEPTLKDPEDASKLIVEYAEFRKKMKMPVMQHLIVMQNANRWGLTLKLKPDSLVEVITHFALSCSSNYKELLPTTLNYKDVVAFGLSSLQVDKFLMVDYLLHSTMLNAMDVASVNEKEVSASYANEAAASLLKGKPQLLSRFFEEYDAAKLEKPFSEVQAQFQKEAKDVLEQCEKVLGREKSIPVKTAILATLLSKTDCELFAQSVYNRDGVCIYDLFSEGLDFFIANDYGGYYADEEGNGPINPIPELKEVNAKVIDLEAQKRAFTEQMAQLEQQIQGSHEVQHCHIEDGVFHFNEQNFRLMPNVEQELLEETFQPKEGGYIPESIDLRCGFRPIQNQGEQGSCLAHALTAIFEYAMKLSTHEELDLSEAFLYYNAREMDQTGDVSVVADNGSRVKPAVQSLGKYGLAQEQYCRYNDKNYTSKPSEEAYTDAAKRKLIKAMNVGKSTPDIKAALAEGYPVAVSLMLCESFAKASLDGYVQMPTEEEIEVLNAISDEEKPRHSCHAMVVVGFSDKLQRFILRNSWGDDWGEGGYCYVPYTYIDHGKLCNSATILTEIDSLSQVRMIDIPTLSVNDQDLHIRYYIVQAMRAKMEADLQAFQQRRQQLFFMCTELTTRFSSLPHVRDEYLQVADKGLEKRIDEMRTRRRKIEEILETLGKNQRRYNRLTLIRIICFALAVVAFVYSWNYLWRQSDWQYFDLPWWVKWVAIGSYTLWSAYMAHQRWKSYREAKHQPAEEDRSLQKEIVATQKVKAQLKYKTYAAYHLLQMMDGVRNRLEDKYLNFLKLLNNLRTWYQEILLSQTKIELAKSIPTFSLLDQALLDQFFEEVLKNDDSCEIDFAAAVSHQPLSDSDLGLLRQRLVDETIVHLCCQPQVAQFNLADHILKTPATWVMAVDRRLANECARQADLFVHFSAQASNDIVCSQYLFGQNVAEHQVKLSEKFMSLMGYYNIPDPYRMTYITIATLEFKDCEALK